MERPQHLFDLPNEILVSVLSLFQTAELLPLTCVSRRFHYLTLRLLHFRLLLAASNPSYKIILEAYVPSRRYTRPYLYCTYLGTDGLSSSIEGEGSLYADCKDENGNDILGGRLAKLSGLYSRFRPEYPGVQGQMPVRKIAGAAPNLQSNTSGLSTEWYSAPGYDANVGPAPISEATGSDPLVQSSTPVAGVETAEVAHSAQVVLQQGSLPQSQPIWSDFGDGGAKKIFYTLNFDEDELFGQFCSVASLVRLGPRRGVFQSYMPLCTDRQGVIRVWREWLLDRAKGWAQEEGSRGEQLAAGLERTSTGLRPEDIVQDRNVLWTDYTRNMGLKIGVKEIEVPGIPMSGPDVNKDDMPLSFEIEIREFIIRTSNLVLAVENSETSQTKPGNALIFGNFAVVAQ